MKCKLELEYSKVMKAGTMFHDSFLGLFREHEEFENIPEGVNLNLVLRANANKLNLQEDVAFHSIEVIRVSFRYNFIV